MLENVFSILGLDYASLAIPDSLLYMSLFSLLLYIVSEVFRIVALIIDRFGKRR